MIEALYDNKGKNDGALIGISAQEIQRIIQVNPVVSCFDGVFRPDLGYVLVLGRHKGNQVEYPSCALRAKAMIEEKHEGVQVIVIPLTHDQLAQMINGSAIVSPVGEEHQKGISELTIMFGTTEMEIFEKLQGSGQIQPETQVNNPPHDAFFKLQDTSGHG